MFLFSSFCGCNALNLYSLLFSTIYNIPFPDKKNKVMGDVEKWDFCMLCPVSAYIC